MGRFNWIWRALWTLSVLVCAFGNPAGVDAAPVDPNLPIAFPGTSQTITSGEIGQLNGSATTELGKSIIGQKWIRIGGTGSANRILLSNGKVFRPTFTYALLTSKNTSVTHIYSLSVVDSDNRSSTNRNSVTITINPPPNAVPTADAGADQTVVSGMQVALGGQSTDDGTVVEFGWARIGGTGGDISTINFSDAAAPNPTFTDTSLTSNDTAVTHIFSLTVKDDDGAVSTNASTVTITISPPANVVPTANAGAVQTVVSGTQVTLAGAGTDTDGTILGYAWTRTGGTGAANNATLSSANARNPTFTDGSLTSNDSPVTHIFSLTLTDDDGAVSINASTVTITINPPDKAVPTPDTTPPVVTVPENIAVNATAGSDTATVDFTTPTAIDAVDGAIAPVLVSSPTAGLDSGSSFPIGVTTLTYMATDVVGNVGTASFTVMVSDNEAPVVTVPENIAVNAAAGSDTAIVDFTAPTAMDAVDGTVTPVLVSSPTQGLDSGSAFPIGVTTLTYTATDVVGNVSTASFTVTVSDVTPPVEVTEMMITTNPDGSITVSGMAEPDATVQVTFPDGSEFTLLNGNIVNTIPPKISDFIKARLSRNKQGTTNKAADNGSTFSLTSASGQPSGNVQIVVIDAAGNSSETSNMGFVAGPTPEQTQEQIAGYMQNRASQTIASQPDLIGLLSGGSTGGFNADVTQSNGNFDLATPDDQPVWATLQGSWSEFGTTESSYFFGTVGAHTQVSPDVLVGIMSEFDTLTQTDGASSSEGDGYLVGPYFVAKLPNQPLFIEGRLLTGQTENQVSVVGVDGTATETFDTRRTFASIKVAGQLNYGELVLTPSLTATHLRDAQDAFANTQGNIVAAQGIEVSSVAAGLNFAQAVSLSNGELMLIGGVSGIWSSSEGTGFASSVAPTTDGQRARITLGASFALPNGVVLSTGTFYDGIGVNDYESYGLDLGVQMQF
jgi:hypothetical protein